MRDGCGPRLTQTFFGSEKPRSSRAAFRAGAGAFRAAKRLAQVEHVLVLTKHIPPRSRPATRSAAQNFRSTRNCSTRRGYRCLRDPSGFIVERNQTMPRPEIPPARCHAVADVREHRRFDRSYLSRSAARQRRRIQAAAHHVAPPSDRVDVTRHLARCSRLIIGPTIVFSSIGSPR